MTRPLIFFLTALLFNNIDCLASYQRDELDSSLPCPFAHVFPPSPDVSDPQMRLDEECEKFDLPVRSDEDIDPYLALENLSYTQFSNRDGDIVEIKVPLVEKQNSEVDRETELRKCRYLTCHELESDWAKYEFGNRDWISQSYCLFFDTEVNKTTFEGEIIQISIQEVINGKMTGLQFTTFIRPSSKSFSKYSQKVHKITWDELKDKPSFFEIAGPLKAFLRGGDSLLIAHNAAFDMRMLKQEFERLEEIETFTLNYKCTYRMHQRDESREKNPQKLLVSPLKQALMRYVTPEERQEIYGEKRKSREQKKENLKRRPSPSDQPPKKRKLSSGSLGYFIKTVGITSENIGPLCGLDRQTELDKRNRSHHHDAGFDTEVGYLKFKSFNEKKLYEDYKKRKESQEEKMSDENDRHQVNVSQPR